MAVLGGHAAMMLVVRAPHSVTGEGLQTALTEGAGQLGLAIWVQPIVDVGAPLQAGSRWLVSVYGADRPGIVFEVTRLLARAGINVTDLQTRLLDRVYAMSMEVMVPAGADGEQVAGQLDRLANQLGVACSMRPKPEHRARDGAGHARLCRYRRDSAPNSSRTRIPEPVLCLRWSE